MAPLTVACVLRSGGIYDATWVAKLQWCVSRNLRENHRFVCLSDVDVPCERIPLENGWPRWWSKMEVFKLEGPVLFIDLDTLVIDNMADIADQARAPEFTTLRDFYRENGLGSGLMAWNVPMRWLYEQFAAVADETIKSDRGHGDQGFIERSVMPSQVARWQNRLPGQVVSYKAHGCDKEIPPRARIICLHGKPKFHDMPAGSMIRVAWEMAA